VIITLPVQATLTITDTSATFVIDFDNTVAGVNNGTFNGSDLSPTPDPGQLDSNAWKITGMSDGLLDFGGTGKTGDFAKGAFTGAVTSGGLYACEVQTGNYALGIQPTGADFNPGTLVLRPKGDVVWFNDFTGAGT